MQKFFNRELPVEEIGFASVGEMLRRVPKVKVVKPPDTSLVMVFSMGKEEGDGEEKGEEEGEKSEGGGKDAGDKVHRVLYLCSLYTHSFFLLRPVQLGSDLAIGNLLFPPPLHTHTAHCPCHYLR